MAIFAYGKRFDMKGARQGLRALSPLLVFLTVYLVTSVVSADFYKIPVSSAFLVACMFSLVVSGGNIKDKVGTFLSGSGNRNVLLMVWIFILAGAFSGTAKDIGAIEATVDFTMRIIPPKMILAGLFLTSCFISMALGTSVGTIVALVPIAGGIAGQTGTNPAYMAAIIVGGALFGDNLSFISDTTIASTKALGCEMKDKFKANIYIVAPAVVVVTAIYLFQGNGIVSPGLPSGMHEWFKLIPCLLIIALALAGRDVTLVLVAGILANAVIGFFTHSFSWKGWLASLGNGIAGMTDLIVITLLAGGLLEMIRANGGIDFIIRVLTSKVRGKRGAQFSIAALVSLADLCTANNTIAIITTGSIARDISDRAGLDPRKTASILDTFSCMVQGVIPYGAQVMMAAGLVGCSPTSILPHLYYPYMMGIVAVLAILFKYPAKYSNQ